ncbi:hypothetical protein LSH36_2517g00000 [Paralvinella palmiformis]|uniref:Uncharacterized protein n=1 Tax=Paralvinella palmiformis TaxID=53620 RepID=A0AAD9MKG2_9ANNE|nr:hypothetical protein LSH36_2517g00000 [Paralvinella palmiformis]
MARFYARSKIHCVVLSHRHRSRYYQWQTIEYRDRQCTLYAETTETEVCCETMKTGYWSKSLSSQGWIPIFQANNGSGLDVYNAWNSSNFNITTMEGPSPLKTQQAIWQIIKGVFQISSKNMKQVSYIIFNASGSTSSDWFSHDRIIDSSYVNMTATIYSPKNFGIIFRYSHKSVEYGVVRRFYGYWFHAGCSKDRGWIAVLDISKGWCNWEQNGFRPSFMYCSGNTDCLFAGK